MDFIFLEQQDNFCVGYVMSQVHEREATTKATFIPFKFSDTLIHISIYTHEEI